MSNGDSKTSVEENENPYFEDMNIVSALPKSPLPTCKASFYQGMGRGLIAGT